MTTRTGSRNPCRTATHCPVGGEATAGHQTVEVRVEHQGLSPRVQGRKDPGLGPEILRVPQQDDQGVPHRRQYQRGHHRRLAEPQRIEVMWDRTNHMVMVPGEPPGALGRQAAFAWEERTLGARAMAKGVVPDATDMAVGTGVDMATQRCGATRHDGAGRFAHVGRQRLALLGGRVGGLENGWERHQGHRGRGVRSTTSGE